MDLIKKILYTVTYPLWYILALMIGKQDSPPAIEGSHKADPSGSDIKLAPLEKFDPVEWERSARAIHAQTDERVGEIAQQASAEISKLKENTEAVAEKVCESVKAFGEDLAPAEFIDADADEDEGESEEFDDDSIENLETDEDLVLPDSVKKATEELQKEIEETMKLRDQLKEAAERSQRRFDDVVGETQKPDKESSDSTYDASKEKAIEVAKKTQEEIDRVAKATKEAAKKAFSDTRQAEQEAATRIQGAIGGAGTTAQNVGQFISKKADESFKKEGGRDVGGVKNLQDELNEAMKSTQKAVKEAKETAGGMAKSLDKETRDRFKAVEQGIQEDVGTPLKKFNKN